MAGSDVTVMNVFFFFVCLKYLKIPQRQWVPIEGVSLLLNYSSS